MSTKIDDELFGSADLQWEKLKNKLFLGICFTASLFGVVMLVFLLADVAYEAGIGIVEFDINIGQFLTEGGRRDPEDAGFYAAIVASVWLMALTAVMAFVVGVGSAIYLEEYAPDTRITRLIEANLANLAGVPSVVYGLLVLAAVVNGFGTGSILLAGAIALALLIVPIIIVSTQEALRAVPDGLRNGSYATGATQWQTIRQVVLPAAIPGILTGTILALARAIGETAPLIMVGILFTARRPPGPLDSFSAMPSQIYVWAAQPQPHFHHLAALGIVVLLAFMLTMNAVAVFLRNRYEREL
ncbi:phosphate ABC transporter permease PstA [Natronoglomus mannanivorans]|uniref:Phosphate transport system permease protein PstA n=1 Tax=Natronoglomus mannanivorans TaxID=2979990 RepID=A0AAP2Z0N8_9EURY|nr:phosphate ABC transporter permease PstA [Halobacteria archaeon AArc-xg1-1]